MTQKLAVIVFASSRAYEKGPYNIQVSEAQIKAAGENNAVGIPLAHNRKRRDARIVGEVKCIYTNRREVKTPYKVGDIIAFRPQYNDGTKKWPDIYYPVRFAKIKKINPVMIETEYAGSISKQYVLGRMRK